MKSKMKTYRVLFVCLGNICRSPAAQGVFEKLIQEEDTPVHFIVDSAGTYSGHQGELPDARMRAHALRRGYELTHRSRPVRVQDFEDFDIILAMDDRNFDDLRDMAPTVEAQDKVKRMANFCTRLVCDSVPDPYYGGAQGFENVLDMLEDSCAGLLAVLTGRCE